MPRRSSDDDYKPLYSYSVRDVGSLLLCLKPHVLRAIRDNLVEREPDFDPGERIEASRLVEHIEEMLVDLDGEA